MSIVVVVPSRGRPDAARLTVEAVRNTAALVETEIIVAVDADDPDVDRYRAAVAQTPGRYSSEATLVVLGQGETGNLVRATNTVARRVAAARPESIIGNLGDDHRPRTYGWDRRVAAALETPGMAYGDDQIHGERLPSAPFVSAALVNALGWYFHPALEHCYVDDAWRELAEAANVRRYLPDVVIEHMHPGVGKSPWDAGYLAAKLGMEREQAVYETWRSSSAFANDVATIQAAAA